MKWIVGLVSLMLCACGGLAFAQVPETVDQLAPYLPAFVEAMMKGDMPVILGFALMTAMTIVRQYILPTAKINSDHLPFIVAAVGGLSMGGLAIVSEGAPVLEAIKNGLIGAFVAAGLWDLLGKYLAKLVFGDKYKVAKDEPKS